MKLTKQGVRDLNGLTPKPPKKYVAVLGPALEKFTASDARQFAEDAIKVYELNGDATQAVIWRLIIGRYNTEIDRLTAELARARKGDRT